MDGTRIIRAIELYRDKYLVGREFPPDLRLFLLNLLNLIASMAEIQKFVLEVRRENGYSAEANISGNFLM